MEDIFSQLDSGAWADPNPSRCPCHSGWLLSDHDTWHCCPIHGRGTPHPEDEEAEFDYAAHALRIYRDAWRTACRRSEMTPSTFRAAVCSHVRATVRATTFTPTMYEWVDFAFDVADKAWQEAQDARARSMGYSCRLEAAWAADAEVEAHARHLGMDPEDYAPRGSPECADRDSWYC